MFPPPPPPPGVDPYTQQPYCPICGLTARHWTGCPNTPKDA